MDRPRTLGELKQSGYPLLSVKEEMRRNLIRKLRLGQPLFAGIVGYDDTVLPALQNAVLARHDILLLGLRGQAKTRLLRQLVQLLDEVIPIVAGSEISDHPLAPVSHQARQRVGREGDATPIEWLGRERRYQEKLATPDVTIADLLGDIDLLKHVQGRSLADEDTLHFGLIPRANRGIFCLNELPDLSPRIQVGLFNVLEERDLQVRGYAVRLPLDLCLVFSANPEDYTNRGRIVTPLKDRIGSVIRTHYPRSRAEGVAILEANAWSDRDAVRVLVPLYLKEIIEETARLARASPMVNQQSGVSVRLSIAGLEVVVSNAERRALRLGEPLAVPRLSDLAHLPAASRGKIELALGDEDSGQDELVEKLTGEAVKKVFLERCDPGQLASVVAGFSGGRTLTTGDMIPAEDYLRQMQPLPALLQAVKELAGRSVPDATELPEGAGVWASVAELILEGLYRCGKLGRVAAEGRVIFGEER